MSENTYVISFHVEVLAYKGAFMSSLYNGMHYDHYVSLKFAYV